MNIPRPESLPLIHTYNSSKRHESAVPGIHTHTLGNTFGVTRDTSLEQSNSTDDKKNTTQKMANSTDMRRSITKQNTRVFDPWRSCARVNAAVFRLPLLTRPQSSVDGKSLVLL